MPENDASWAARMAEILMGTDWPDARPGIATLREFVEARRRGEAPSESTLAALEAAFARILDGEKADVVLQLKRRPGKPRSPSVTMRNMAIVIRLAELRCSLTEGKALEQVVLEYGISESVAQDLYDRYVSGREFPKSRGNKTG